jgi:hypothetical protein
MLSPQHTLVLAVAAVLGAGCAEHLTFGEHGSGGWNTGYLFWPPPPCTSMQAMDLVETPEWASFGGAAQQIADILRQAGYGVPRVYPVGARYEHGFALTTQLERIHDDGSPELPAERWSPRFAEPASLIWLANAHELRLPARGRYRSLLIAVTDLTPSGYTTRPPRWNEQTVMDGPGLRPAAFPVARRVPLRARIVVYVYEYRSDDEESAGEAVRWGDAKLTAAAHLERTGLAALGMIP